MSMTTDQVVMARHALGLPNSRGRSYRNRYAASIGSNIEAEWDDLVRQGYAERGHPGQMLIGFCLTERGARQVLASGETLDPEDFPVTA